jgi:hypothetical protein
MRIAIVALALLAAPAFAQDVTLTPSNQDDHVAADAMCRLAFPAAGDAGLNITNPTHRRISVFVRNETGAYGSFDFDCPVDERGYPK